MVRVAELLRAERGVDVDEAVAIVVDAVAGLGGSWVDRTNAAPGDYVGGRVCGTTDTLSPFASAPIIDTAPPTFTSPASLAIRTGRALPTAKTTSALPVMLSWLAADEALGSGLDHYALERQAFGRKIGSFQGISFKLADMAMAVRQSELLLRDTNWRVDKELPHVTDQTQTQVSMAKCLAADTAMKVSLEAVQILGGYGYMREYQVERMMRDAKAIQIFDGSNEIQRVIIGRYLLRNAQ